MPQTKFVLKKSLELGLHPIVVINKMDKPSARADWVVDQLFDLFVQLGASDEQLEHLNEPVYAIARDGKAWTDENPAQESISPLLDFVMEKVAEAPNDTSAPFKMQIANLGYDSFLGRLGIGRVYEGIVKVGQDVYITSNDGVERKGKITEVLTNNGLLKEKSTTAEAGDIVTIAGIPDIFVGETVASESGAEVMPAITIDEPTLKMEFLVNNSPFAGKE
jgi:GTP-binding protein